MPKPDLRRYPLVLFDIVITAMATSATEVLDPMPQLLAELSIRFRHSVDAATVPIGLTAFPRNNDI